MRHPKEEYNQRQAAFLASLPEDQREYQARMFRIGNAAYAYQTRFNEIAKIQDTGYGVDGLLEWLEQQRSSIPQSQPAHELLQVYFEEWLEGLPTDRIRNLERTRGLDDAKRNWEFRRYVLERNDIGMDEFMRLNLSEEDYQFYLESSNLKNSQ